jgi:4-aminobutyrate aminotransferase-like enzyme
MGPGRVVSTSILLIGARQMWASEHFGVVPDIFTAATGIASG